MNKLSKNQILILGGIFLIFCLILVIGGGYVYISSSLASMPTIAAFPTPTRYATPTTYRTVTPYLSNSNVSSGSSGSSGFEKHITGNQWFGCIDRQYFEKIVGYSVDHDSQAMQQALTAGLYSGTCTIFNYGDTVYITDSAPFSGEIKIRRQGETDEWWTFIEAAK